MRQQRWIRSFGARVAGSALAAATLAAAPEAGAETLSWAAVKARAASRSPAAVQGRATARQAEAEATGAGRWPRSNPSLTGSFETGAPFGEAADRALAVGVEQELDVVGVAATASRAARAAVAVAGREGVILRRGGMAEAADAFVDLDRAQRALAIWTELDAALRTVATGTAKAASAGERPELEAILADADSAGATAELAQARADLTRAQARLAVLVAADPTSLRVTAPEAAPAPDPRSLQALLAAATRRRPEAALWQARREEAEARGAFAARSALPQPTLGLGLRDEQLAAPGDPAGAPRSSTTLEVHLSVPLPLFDRNQAERARATADASAALEGAEIAARETRAGVVRARAAVDASWAALARWQEVLPRLTRAAALLQQGYAAGQIDLVDALTGLERVARARGRALDARAAYLKARAELSLAVGEEP